MSDPDSSYIPSPKKRRSVRKTCEPCKIRSTQCSASLPCQQCIYIGQSTSCHYRGGLRLNMLQRSNQPSKSGAIRPLKATGLNVTSKPANSPQSRSNSVGGSTRPSTRQPSPRRLSTNPARQADRTRDTREIPLHKELRKRTFEPDSSVSTPCPLDALTLLAHQAASHEACATETPLNEWSTRPSRSASKEASNRCPQVGLSSEAETSRQTGQAMSSVQSTGGRCETNQHDSQPLRIVLPFFRYFGNTAIAPGIRCVEVEVQDEQTTLLHSHQVSGNAANSASSHGSPLGASGPHAAHPQSTTAADSESLGTLSNQSDEQPGISWKSTRMDPYESTDRKLFDAENTSLPAREVLEHLLPLFFGGLACYFPFLSEERIMHDFKHGLLEPLEANCLAALACRFSTQTTTTLTCTTAAISTSEAKMHGDGGAESEDAYTRAEPFADKAKELIYPLFSLPSLKVCQALVMMTWIEWGSDRDSGAWLWSGLSIRMCQDIGLSYWDSLEAVTDGEEKRIHRLTFWAVYFLDRVISYGAGRRVTIAQSDIEIEFPTSQECHASRCKPADSSVSHPWPYLMQLLGHRGNISDWLNNRSKTDLTQEMERGKEILSDFFCSLPVDMRFNVSNLRNQSHNEAAPVLVMMHCMLHSLVCLLHRPSLVHSRMNSGASWSPLTTRFNSGFSNEMSMGIKAVLQETGAAGDFVFPAECASSARSISDMLSFSRLMDERTIVCNPYMDHAVFIGGVALLEELEYVMHHGQKQDRQAGTGTHGGEQALDSIECLVGDAERRMEVEMLTDKLEVTRKALVRLSRYWGGIRWVCKWLEDESRHTKRLKRVEKEGGGLYKAAPAKVKADMMRSLARLGAANPLCVGKADAGIKTAASTNADQACGRARTGTPAATMNGAFSTKISGGEDVPEGSVDADGLWGNWEELEALLSDRGLVLDGMFDFDLPWMSDETSMRQGPALSEATN